MKPNEKVDYILEADPEIVKQAAIDMHKKTKAKKS